MGAIGNKIKKNKVLAACLVFIIISIMEALYITAILIYKPASPYKGIMRVKLGDMQSVFGVRFVVSHLNPDESITIKLFDGVSPEIQVLKIGDKIKDHGVLGVQVYYIGYEFDSGSLTIYLWNYKK